MIEIKLGEKKYSISEYMTIDQYQKIQTSKILEEDINPKKLLSIYLDISVDELNDAYMDQVQFVEQYVYSQITKNINKEVILTFDLSGTTYGFENNWKKLTWGFWSDLEFLTADDINSNIHRIMAVLYRPVKNMKGTNYEITPYKSDTMEERAELFKQAPINLWFGASNVFFYISARYTTSIRDTIKWGNKIKKLIMTGYQKMPKFLKKRLSLDSILQPPLNLPKTISQNLK